MLTRPTHVCAIYAYADSLGHAPTVLARLRAVAMEGCRDTDAARYFAEAALVVGAFDLAMMFLGTAAEGLRAEGRLGHLPRTLAPHGFVAARLADWDVAIPAAEESRRLGAEFGETLTDSRADNIIAESRAPLRTARDTFDALSCVDWGDRARRELRASGEASRRRDPPARDQLTALELQIAQLAAEGLSNREIGARLYLSPRTISTHLYHVFPKLAITARSQLALALAPPMELTR